MVSILLTRPQAASERMAQALRLLGYDCVIEPLLTIVSETTPMPDQHPTAIMITSAHALDALESNPAHIAGLMGLPCFCVGPHTAARAQAFGFANVLHSTSDGAELASLISAKLASEHSTILHIAGRDVDSKARDMLIRNSFVVVTWVVYAAEPVTTLSPTLLDRFQKQQLDAAIFFSPQTAATMKNLFTRYGIEACCQSLIAIGLSEAVINALRPLPWRKSLAALAPTQEAVLNCLKDVLPSC